MAVTSTISFTLFYGAAAIIGGLGHLLLVIWLGRYRGGFGWRSDPSTEYNWHPLLMITGMILMQGNGSLIFRTFPNQKKLTLKLMHMSIHLISFICAVVGLIAVFDSHNLAKPPIPNLYTLHSWVGLSTIVLFAAQWCLGFGIFLYPGCHMTLRKKFYQYHITIGLTTFVLSTISSLLGISEKAIFSVENYSTHTNEGLLVNTIGVTIILYCVIILNLIIKKEFKRQPEPEDGTLLERSE